MPESDRIQRWLSTRELAERWGISTRTLEDWRLDGTGPEWARFGQQVRYSDVAIHEWEQRQTQRVS